MAAGLRIARTALVTANVLTFAVAAWLWPSLPDRVPMHYGLDGAPDGWADKGVLAWFLWRSSAARSWRRRRRSGRSGGGGQSAT